MMMKFNPKITREEINQLETTEFSGEIIVVDNLSEIHAAIEYLNTQKIVGIDTETRPSFSKGTNHKVSLIQLSTENKCYLFRLNKIGFPPELLDFLSNIEIKKVGLSLRDDLNSMNKRHKIIPQSFVDIQNIVKEYGILDLSLQKIFAIIFEKKISKSQRLTNWELQSLSESQKRYAATDAWACLKIYKELSNQKKISKKELQDIILACSEPTQIIISK